jgi:hypothetical protein
MAVYLARDCPMCGNYFGVIIARPNGSGYRPAQWALRDGYEIVWALISSRAWR